MTLRLTLRSGLLLLPLLAVLLLISLWTAAQLPRAPQLAFKTECRGYDGIGLVDVRIGVWQMLLCDRATKVSLEWSPDGERLAYFNHGDIAASSFSLAVLNPDTDELAEYRFEDEMNPNFAQPITWSPDGREIAFIGLTSGSTAWRLFVLNLASGEIRTVTGTHGDGYGQQRGLSDMVTDRPRTTGVFGG